MAKLWIMGLVCLAAFLEVTVARDLAESIDNDVREQLKGYEQFLANDDGSHKADLTKLIEITESALKAEGVDAKQAILKDLQTHFSPEFNTYISIKLEEFQVNDDIEQAIEFYQSLIAGKSEFKDEIEKTIATLQTIQKEADLKQKEEKFLALNKDFTPEFQKFLDENALPSVNRELQKVSEFFENLLVEDDIKYAEEIKQLKAQADAALGNITIDEKQSALHKVTNPENRDLYEYLQKRFIELN